MAPTLYTLHAAEPMSTESSTEDQEERRPYLGIVPERARSTGAAGVSVMRVYPSSTAERLGIVGGDRILRFNGETIRDADHLDSLVKTQTINDEVTVEWMHDGNEQSGTQALGAIPLSRLQTIELAQLRANVRRLDQERRSLEEDEQTDSDADMATAMAALAKTLNALPGQLEDASRIFKQLYPDGTFSIHIEIDIRTNSTDPEAIELGPGIVPPAAEKRDDSGDQEATETDEDIAPEPSDP